MFARIRSPQGANLLVELVMIVVGINIALWFEAWFDDLQDRELEQQYLEGLRDDLLVDLDGLGKAVKTSEAKLEALGEIIPTVGDLDTAPPEQQAAALFEPSSYWFFDPSDFTYRSMQDSGDFRLLSEQEIKKGLLKMARHYRLIDTLQKNYLQAADDEYIPLLMSGFDLMEMRITDPALAESQVLRNFFAFAYQDTEGRLQAYKAARDEATMLLARIEKDIE